MRNLLITALLLLLFLPMLLPGNAVAQQPIPTMVWYLIPVQYPPSPVPQFVPTSRPTFQPWPTIIPARWHLFELLMPITVYTCPDFRCVFGYTLKAHVKVWVRDVNNDWYQLMDGDYYGNYIHQDGTLDHLI